MPRLDKDDVIPFVIAILIAAVIAVWGWIAITPPNAGASPAFDHSQCQYPDRDTNPVDGCDNSDFADPSCIKTGLSACDLPQKEVSQSVSDVKSDSTSSQKVLVQNCTDN